MAQVLEWFQCKKCGRRHRWTADNAGKDIPCGCGTSVRCPLGAGLDDSSMKTSAGALSDTLIEDAELAGQLALTENEALKQLGVEGGGVVKRPLTAEERRNAKVFFIWFGVALVGFAMVVHVIFLASYWPQFWWYTVLAVLIAPLSTYKANRARRRFQKEQRFFDALGRYLGADQE